MSKNSTNVIHLNFADTNVSQLLKYQGFISEATAHQVSSTRYAVTDLILSGVSGTYRRFGVSLKAGLPLFEYINTRPKGCRTNEIFFQFEYDPVRQQIQSYKAFDPCQWVNDLADEIVQNPRFKFHITDN